VSEAVSAEPRKLEFRRLADVEMRSIEWLEKPLWQRAAFHLVAGKKGSGKGTYVARLAARVSLGALFDQPMNVLLAAGEDSDEIDLKPRIVAAGGDPERIASLTSPLLLPRDIPALREAALDVGDVGLIVLDPIASYVRGDTHAEDPVRFAIDPLNGLADELSCLLIGVRHFKKDTSGGALDSITGAGAWRDVPRAVLGVAADDEVENVFHIIVAAANRSARGQGRKFRIELVDVGLAEPVTLAVDLGESDKALDDLLGQHDKRPAPKRDAAAKIILRELAVQPQSLDNLKAVCIGEVGCSGDTVWQAANALKGSGQVDSRNSGPATPWLWFLTSPNPKSASGYEVKNPTLNTDKPNLIDFVTKSDARDYEVSDSDPLNEDLPTNGDVPLWTDAEVADELADHEERDA
jgi:AAA domain